MDPEEILEDVVETPEAVVPPPVIVPQEPEVDERTVYAWLAQNRPDMLQQQQPEPDPQVQPYDGLDEYGQEVARTAYNATVRDVLPAATSILRNQLRIENDAVAQFGDVGRAAAQAYFDKWPQTAFMNPTCYEDVMDKVRGDLIRSGKMPTTVTSPSGATGGVGGGLNISNPVTDEFEAAFGFKPSKAVLAQMGGAQ